MKNTWDLGLIDHLSELVRVDSDDVDAETNFQKVLFFFLFFLSFLKM